MGRPGRIAKVNEDGSVSSIYLHYTLPHEAGLLLHKHFDDESSVDWLLEQGNLAYIIHREGKPEDYPSKRDPNGGWAQQIVEPKNSIYTLDENCFIQLCAVSGKECGTPGETAETEENLQTFLSKHIGSSEWCFIYGTCAFMEPYDTKDQWYMTSKDFENMLLPMSMVQMIMEKDQYYYQ